MKAKKGTMKKPTDVDMSVFEKKGKETKKGSKTEKKGGFAAFLKMGKAKKK